jgi:hypothetical protein
VSATADEIFREAGVAAKIVGFENLEREKKMTVRSGADVMITIFCDFRQFSAKKLAFFSKTNVMIKILHNLALF